MQNFDETIANQLMNDLKNLILDFETKHHLDLIVKFEPERWCYTSDMNYMDVSELIREFFESHYPGQYAWNLCVFEEIAEECEDKSIAEFCDKIISTTKKLLNEHLGPIVDKHWDKIEETMSKVQKYFPGLKIIKECTEYDGYDVDMIYFVRNKKLIGPDIDQDALYKAYNAITDLCYETTYVGIESPIWIRYKDYWFEDMQRYVPEDQIDKINFSDYVILQYSDEYDFKAAANVFKYFDKNNDIKIKVW